MADLSAPSLETLAESTQMGAGEFYQIVSDQVLANYPVTAGLMPWVFKRPWPVIAIMLVDGFGHPAQVTLNGKTVGRRARPPFRFDLQEAARQGSNEILVEVTNTVGHLFVPTEAPPVGLLAVRFDF
jgi:hypothetical protein